MSTELLVTESYIKSVISGDSDITDIIGTAIYLKVAPQGSPGHRIVFQCLSSPDTNGVGGRRFFTRPLYNIFQEFDPEHADDTNLIIISKRLDALFDRGNINSQPAYGDLIVSASHRTAAYSDSVNDSNITYERVGGHYRFEVRRANT